MPPQEVQIGNKPQLDPPTSFQHARKEKQFYRPELDGLRFFAFLAVFEAHTTLNHGAFYAARHIPAWLANLFLGISIAGGHGVDLFFALSAYLITELLLREKSERGSLDVRSFYIRRILRIWPLYYLFIFVAEVASQHIPGLSFPFPYFLAFALLAGNWSLIAFGRPLWIGDPLWSVSIEEQFYLLWPPIVALLTRRGIVVAAAAMICVANLTRIALVLAHCTSWQIYFNTLVRLDQIAGGILLAVLLRHRVPDLRSGLRLALIAAAVLGFVLTGYIKVIQPQALRLEVLGSYPVSAICCTLLVYSFLGMRFQSQSLRYLGKISYGLYVFHYPCIALVNRYIPFQAGIIQGVLRLAFNLGFTILVAALSYRFLESPFLKLKRRFTYVESRPV